MFGSLYDMLAKFGYTHPIHPTITHLPIGLVMGAFLFALGVWISRGAGLVRTARHCMILALIALLPTVLLGYMDWQQFYAGAWLFPIKMKFLLASSLLILLILAVIFSLQTERVGSKNLLVYLLCLLNVLALGFFGGELVYGVKEPVGTETPDAAAAGALVFQQNCAACHHADSTDTKIGPGLKGIFKQDEFPVSGWPANEENFRKQLKTPFGKMPSFAQLPDEQIDELIAYLKSL